MPEALAPLEKRQDESKQLKRSLGRLLKSLREKAGLSQAQLAKNLGLSYHTAVSQVEAGSGRIPQPLYGQWADQLQMDRTVFAILILKHLEPGLFDLLDSDCFGDFDIESYESLKDRT